MATAERKYPAPAVNPEIKRFFDAAVQGNLMLKKCAACGQSHFYPRAICPYCASDRTEWVTSSGRGTIYSYEVVMHAIQPGFKEIAPYPVVLVELDEQRGRPTPDEGLRIIANLVTTDDRPEAEENVAIGKLVRVTFQDLAAHMALPQFTLIDERPAGRTWRFPD